MMTTSTRGTSTARRAGAELLTSFPPRVSTKLLLRVHVRRVQVVMAVDDRAILGRRRAGGRSRPGQNQHDRQQRRKRSLHFGVSCLCKHVAELSASPRRTRGHQGEIPIWSGFDLRVLRVHRGSSLAGKFSQCDLSLLSRGCWRTPPVPATARGAASSAPP